MALDAPFASSSMIRDSSRTEPKKGDQFDQFRRDRLDAGSCCAAMLCTTTMITNHPSNDEEGRSGSALCALVGSQVGLAGLGRSQRMHNIKFAVFYYYFYLRSFPADPSRSRVVVVGCVAPIPFCIHSAQLTYRLLCPSDRHLGSARGIITGRSGSRTRGESGN